MPALMATDREQFPQLEEYLFELSRLGMLLYNKNTRRYYISERAK
jgi:hypothetical protein